MLNNTYVLEDESSPRLQKLIYVSGNATVRSSSHRLRGGSKWRNEDPGPKLKEANKRLPLVLKQNVIERYDTKKFDLKKEIMELLKNECVKKKGVGSWENQEYSKGLEYFRIPTSALLKANSRNVQDCLSSQILQEKRFLQVFDKFVYQILENLKLVLLRDCDTQEKLTFYYQRPPTLRLQPGPSSQCVPKHKDSEYGHQDGEINFWLPLTDRNLTQTDLFIESAVDSNEYQPVKVNYGEVLSFHGSSLRHYLPPNKTRYSRVSLDFRVGIKGFFDPNWKLRGTLEDHSRMEISL